MTPRLRHTWQRTPRRIRRPIVLVVGWTFIIASPLLGWLPGPGGIPLFLLGIAVLSTEFAWAKRFRDWVLSILDPIFKWCRKHPVSTVLFIIAFIAILFAAGYYASQLLFQK